ncbi:hypothetical protein [Acidianus sp. RZ1]|uniref:hypothetical protein n=1 Tax=Acidianus sp. RZ1 TaxID=1540082 RepID=UPI001490D621|nr:hypothetical protein [Acidianus sp. RZ1]NON62645.1 hypothetical protein [Acidianus sp. RZ1]
MLLKIKIKGEEILPSQIKGKMAYEKNVVLIAKTPARVLFVDFVGQCCLGSYSPPPFLSSKMFYYEIIYIPEEYSKYLPCIALEVEKSLNPLYRNKRLYCDGEITVVIEK